MLLDYTLRTTGQEKEKPELGWASAPDILAEGELEGWNWRKGKKKIIEYYREIGEKYN